MALCQCAVLVNRISLLMRWVAVPIVCSVPFGGMTIWIYSLYLGADNCDLCSDSSFCNLCRSGFYWDGSSCQTCSFQFRFGYLFFLGYIYFMILVWCIGSSPCVSCRGPSSSSCTECPSSMALAIDGSCVTCGSGFYYSDATSPCGSCLLVVMFE